KRLLEYADLGGVGAPVQIPDRPDRRRRLEVADRLPAGQGLAPGLRKLGIVRQLAGHRALPASAEPGHAPLHIEKEGLAHLLAVAGDVDARRALPLDHLRRRRLALGCEPCLVDRLAPRAAGVAAGEARGPRR